MTNYQLGEFAVRFMVGGRNFNQKITVPCTILSLKLLTLFLKQGLVQSFSVKSSTIEVKLKYYRKKPLIKSMALISTPGRRVYWTRGQLSKRYNAHNFGGFYIISTSGGLYTSNECLTTNGLGGEVVYKIILN
jgi:small subunit ribosomal protein S8